MGGCQNYGPFLGPYYSTAPINLGYPNTDPSFDNYPKGFSTTTSTSRAETKIDGLAIGNCSETTRVQGLGVSRVLGLGVF